MWRSMGDSTTKTHGTADFADDADFFVTIQPQRNGTQIFRMQKRFLGYNTIILPPIRF
jgi:hypothetical protein